MFAPIIFVPLSSIIIISESPVKFEIMKVDCILSVYSEALCQGASNELNNIHFQGEIRKLISRRNTRK